MGAASNLSRSIRTLHAQARPPRKLAQFVQNEGTQPMLFRILKMQVRPDRIAEWLAFTRDVGFPGMLQQPGCQAIWRLRRQAGATDFHVMTQWASAADLERFNASEASRDLTVGA